MESKRSHHKPLKAGDRVLVERGVLKGIPDDVANVNFVVVQLVSKIAKKNAWNVELRGYDRNQSFHTVLTSSTIYKQMDAADNRRSASSSSSYSTTSSSLPAASFSSLSSDLAVSSYSQEWSTVQLDEFYDVSDDDEELVGDTHPLEEGILPEEVLEEFTDESSAEEDSVDEDDGHWRRVPEDEVHQNRRTDSRNVYFPLLSSSSASSSSSSSSSPSSVDSLTIPKLMLEKPVLSWTALHLSVLDSVDSYHFSRMQDRAEHFVTREPFHYFLMAFPVDIIPIIVKNTNKRLQETYPGAVNMTVSSFFTYIMLYYLMSLFPGQARRRYFETTPYYLSPVFNFGRFMKQSHFERFARCMVWAASSTSSSSSSTSSSSSASSSSFSSSSSSSDAQPSTDRWSPIRGFYDAFNDRRLKTVEPSKHICIDEAMSANRTKQTEAYHVEGGLPHQIKIARKPEGVGVEIRCVADGVSGIMLRLELQESMESMRNKPYVNELKLAGAACLMRLAEPWFYKNITFYGDSAFASAPAAHVARNKGLHFIGLVKTAHKGYPKTEMNSMENRGDVAQGSSVYFLNKQNDVELIALGWWDSFRKPHNKKKVVGKHFIATAGTFAEDSQGKIKKRRNVEGDEVEIVVPTPLIVKEYFSFSHKVDLHNRMRQGELALERNIGSRKWQDRLAHTLLGMIMVDAFLMYHNDPIGLDSDHLKHQLLDFVNIICHAVLVRKVFQPSVSAKRPHSSIVREEGDDEEDVGQEGSEGAEISDVCYEKPLRLLLPQGDRKRKQISRKCRYCEHESSYCCGRCSTNENIMVVCTYRDSQSVPCFVVHSREMQAKSD